MYGGKPRLPLLIHRASAFLVPDGDMRYRLRTEELEGKGALLGVDKLRTEAAQLVAHVEEVKRDNLSVGDYVISITVSRDKVQPKHLDPRRVQSK